MQMAVAKHFYRKLTTLPNSTNPITKSVSIRGIIFDMDGTLTLPVLDFRGLRTKLGMDASTDILTFADSHPPDKKKEIYQMIHDWEVEGINNMKLRPHLHQLFYFLKEEQFNVALLTRNNRTGVDAFIKKFLQDDNRGVFKSESDIFSIVLTRDFTPVKPHPAPLHHICSKWNVSEESVIFVGDDVQDIECGNRAGSVSVLVNKPNNGNVREISDFNIDSLSEIVDMLKGEVVVDRTQPRDSHGKIQSEQ